MTLTSRTYLALVVFAVGLALGCATSRVDVTPLPTPSPHHWAELRVRVGEANASDAGFQLVSVAEDMTTTIRLDSGQLLSGRPGDYFAAPLAGASRPRLVSASHQNGEATFRWDLE